MTNEPTSPGWPDPLESPQAEAIRNGKIDDVEIRNLFDQMEREIRVHRKTFCERTANPLQSPQAGFWPITTDDEVEALARECDWNNRRYMTPADYSIWCEQMRKFARLASTGEAVAKMVERVTNRAESLERIGATEDAADLRALLSALADAVPPSIPAGGVREANVDDIAKTIDPHSFLPDNSGDDLIAEMVKNGMADARSKARRVIASLSLPAGGVAVSDAWQPIETAPKDGAYILLSNQWGSWVGHFVPRHQSGFAPDNPWHSLMLNHRHMPGAMSLVPTHWMPLPPAALSPEAKTGERS